jgi:hypothetical protein
MLRLQPTRNYTKGYCRYLSEVLICVHLLVDSSTGCANAAKRSVGGNVKSICRRMHTHPPIDDTKLEIARLCAANAIRRNLICIDTLRSGVLRVFTN